MRVSHVTAEPHTNAVSGIIAGHTAHHRKWIQHRLLFPSAIRQVPYYIKRVSLSNEKTMKLPPAALCHMLDGCVLVSMDLQVDF